MTTLIGLSGSLRNESLNTRLLRAAGEHLPKHATLDLRTLHDVPLYDGDLEAKDGIPQAVETLKQAIADADGLLIATPEYNNAMPGVLKNGIDWLSRPPKDIERVFGGLPVALMGATPGAFGTTLAQTSWLPVMRTLGVRLWTGGRMLLPRAPSAFGEDATLADEDAGKRLGSFLEGFVSFVEEH